MLKLLLEINVGISQQVAREYEPSPTKLTFLAEPEELNPSHAEIKETFAKGLARELSSKAKKHFPADEIL